MATQGESGRVDAVSVCLTFKYALALALGFVGKPLPTLSLCYKLCTKRGVVSSRGSYTSLVAAAE